MFKRILDDQKQKLEAIRQDENLDIKEKRLKLRMLEMQIKVQESVYGMNIVKTVGLIGATISGLLKIFSSSSDVSSFEVNEGGVSLNLEGGGGSPKPHESSVKGQETQTMTMAPRHHSPSLKNMVLGNIWAVFLLVVVVVYLVEWIHRKFKKPEEAAS